MIRRALCWAVLACILAAAAGCGQKGPLYLPGEDGQQEDSQERDGG